MIQYQIFSPTNYIFLLLSRKKRSVSELSLVPGADPSSNEVEELVTVLDAVELGTTLDTFLAELGLEERQCRLRAVCEMYRDTEHSAPAHSEAAADLGPSVRDMVTMLVDTWLAEAQDTMEAAAMRDWIRAADLGRSRGSCAAAYAGCGDTATLSMVTGGR